VKEISLLPENPWARSRWWRFVYRYYPPILRILERVRVHHYRQPYLLGHLAAGFGPDELFSHLEKQGYTHAVLAWRDPGEVLSLRKLDQRVFQYHLRLFDNGELRGHYEYASESNPLGHVFQKVFEPRSEIAERELGPLLDKSALSSLAQEAQLAE